MSPFFLQHGYDVDPIQIAVRYSPKNLPRVRRIREEYEKAKSIVKRLRQSIELAQATIGEAQQEQELQANARRKQAP
jgi:hypothetical protein